MSRRRTATSRAVLGLVVVVCIALGVFYALNGWPETFWGWLLRAGVPLAVLLLALRDYFEQTGRLNRLRNRGLGALALVLGLAALSLTIVGVNRSTPQLGLDLQGGFSVVLTAEGDPAGDTIDQAMEIIRRRIDALGVAEPEVTRQGDDVVVELPGVKDRARAQEVVGTTAKLEFRPVISPMAGIYSPEAEAAGEDPCTALPDPTATPPSSAPADPSTPADPSATTAPAGETTVPPAATTAPADTSAPAGDQEGAGVPGAGIGVVDGDNAGAPIPGRQNPDESSTTAPTPSTEAGGTTVPSETTAPGATTVPVDPAAPGEPAPPADPAAGDTVLLPDEQSGACTLLGPKGFEGDALSKAVAELGSAGQAWNVKVAIKGAQRQAANTLFNSCFNADPAVCPGASSQGKGLLAIVLDDRVVSAPEVSNLNLADEDFVISGGGTDGGFTESAAKDLALKLRYGALPVEFTRSAERQVSPTLGEDSLQAGMLAGFLGLAAVAIYLLVYYRALGVVVVMGLGVWGALMYGVVCWLSATQGLTLSLSGVVGIVVSVGTTVDSYVVHFERLKDEVRLGKSVRASTEKGFRDAFRTILTADLASLMGAVLLWYLTVGAVRGFAFFLGLSVILDLFVAYCFDRPMVALLARSSFFTENRIFGVARGLGRRDGGVSHVGVRS